MSKFIWVRDKDKKEHYINVEHIVRVSKVPRNPNSTYGDYSYIVLNEGAQSPKSISLSDDEFDTFEEVIAKIQQVSA